MKSIKIPLNIQRNVQRDFYKMNVEVDKINYIFLVEFDSLLRGSEILIVDQWPPKETEDVYEWQLCILALCFTVAVIVSCNSNTNELEKGQKGGKNSEQMLGFANTLLRIMWVHLQNEE